MILRDLILEYRKAPRFDELSIVDLGNLIAEFPDKALLPFVIHSESNKPLKVVKVDLSSLQVVFILITRDANITDIELNSIYGYMITEKVKNYLKVLDVSLYKKEAQNKGIGTDLYIKLVQHGYSLMNGDLLSPQAEKLWKEKLGKFVEVRAFNVNTGETSTDLTLPEKDTGISQEWHLTASKSGISEQQLIESWDLLKQLNYVRWLKGSNKTLPQSYCSERYGQDGDF